MGFEPTTYGLQGVCSTADLQPRPLISKEWFSLLSNFPDYLSDVSANESQLELLTQALICQLVEEEKEFYDSSDDDKRFYPNVGEDDQCAAKALLERSDQFCRSLKNV